MALEINPKEPKRHSGWLLIDFHSVLVNLSRKEKGGPQGN